MSNIDKQALREAAEKAPQGKWDYDSGIIWDTDESGRVHLMAVVKAGDYVSDEEHESTMRFIALATPAVVLDLLDELSKSHDVKTNEFACADSTINLAIKWQMQCKAAEERLDELTEFVRHVKKCLVKNGEYAPLSHEVIDTFLGIRADVKGGA